MDNVHTVDQEYTVFKTSESAYFNQSIA